MALQKRPTLIGLSDTQSKIYNAIYNSPLTKYELSESIDVSVKTIANNLPMLKQKVDEADVNLAFVRYFNSDDESVYCVTEGFPSRNKYIQEEDSREPPIRSVTLDIETTSLEGSYGRLLCMSYRFGHETQVRTIKCRFLNEEHEALKQIHELWDKFEYMITWNGKLFDIPFLNGRMVSSLHRLPPLTPKMHEDAMYEWRKVRTRGNKLDFAAKDLGLKVQKYDVGAAKWILAQDPSMEGAEEAFEQIVKHCEQDIKITDAATARLRPFILRITR